MKEIEINVLTKLPDNKIEKALDLIDQVICELLDTEDIFIMSREYKEKNDA